MLTHLRVLNLAVLRDIEIGFGPGLNVLTGETGAGKSILVDAVGLLMGARATLDGIRTGSARAVVEGRFSMRSEMRRGNRGQVTSLVVRREMLRQGPNQVFINSRSASLGELKRSLASKVVMHGQNRHLTLSTPESQRQFLDAAFLGRPGSARLTAAWKGLVDTGRRRQEQWVEISRTGEQLEELERMVGEVDQLKPIHGEVDGLETEVTQLASALDRRAATARIVESLEDGEESASLLLARAGRELEGLAGLDPCLARSMVRLQDLSYALQDIVADVRGRGGVCEVDPVRLDAAQARLARLQRLERRYGLALDALLDRVEEARRQMSGRQDLTERAQSLALEEQQAALAYHQLAVAAGLARQEAAQRLALRVNEELPHLGLGHGTFVVDVQTAQPEGVINAATVRQKGGPSGYDRVVFLFNADPGDPPRPLVRVASGGELSRLLLALTLVTEPQSGTGGPSTCIFDEVDAGIGGEMAGLIGERLKRAALGQQVICVSHLPQIAALADRHICVRKKSSSGRFQTQVETLDAHQREVELGRMLGEGASMSTARRHARALLKAARQAEARAGNRAASALGPSHGEGEQGEGWA